MSSSLAEVGDGPVVLQLRKWDQLQFKLQLSDFLEAFISPSRELLALLSKNSEAVLLPLADDDAGKDQSVSLGKDENQDSSLWYTNLPDYRPANFDAVCDEPCTSESTGVHSAFSSKKKASVFEHYPVISDVKSLTWGHCGDAYRQSGDSGFRELLIVSSGNNITVHAFCYGAKESTDKEESGCSDGDVKGQWVVWKTGCSEQLTEQFLNLESSNLYKKGGFSDNSSVASEPESREPCVNNGKKWFQSFLVDLNTTVSDGKLLGLFPAKSSCPHSADVISFSIYHNTLLFLKFLFSAGHKIEGQTFEDVEAFISNKDAFNISSNFQSDFSFLNCSRVIASSSHGLIGLVVSFTDSSKGDAKNENRNLVVVVMLNHWGLQWLCYIDLQHMSLGSGQQSPWSDFNFSDNFLICLNTSGLIGIWDTNTGDFVTQFDVVRDCQLDHGLPISTISSFEGINIDGKIEQMHKASEGIGSVDVDKSFKRLLVAPHASIIAVVDELGIVYAFYVGNDIIKKHAMCVKSVVDSELSDLGILSRWKVAGSDIGGEYFFNGFSGGRQGIQESVVSSDIFISPEAVHTSREKRKWGLVGNSPSGFGPCHSRSGISPNAMRSVILPLDKFRSDDVICFSSSGVTRLVKGDNGNKQKCCKIAHTDLHVPSSVLDERELKSCTVTKELIIVGEPLGCVFQGCLYLVSGTGLSVILPSISFSSDEAPANALTYWSQDAFNRNNPRIMNMLGIDEPKDVTKPWQLEVLDRILLYEGPKEADLICLDNGWDLKLARWRQMQLALQYMKYDEIERSLAMLVDVNLAEEGVLQLILVSANHIYCRAGRDNEVAVASRLLALAARFATRMIRKYGFMNIKKDNFMRSPDKEWRAPLLKRTKVDALIISRRLSEMSYYLEVIRELQSHLASKNKKQGQLLSDNGDTTNTTNEYSLPVALLEQLEKKEESAFGNPKLTFDDDNGLALQLVDSSPSQRWKLVPSENPKDMITRWHIDNFDPKTVVKDALLAGRLPLAVLQLHLRSHKESASGKPHDTFSIVRDIGKALVYDLFLKGENVLALEMLQKLGEDVEIALRQLLFGTLRRSLRAQIGEEMRTRGYLRQLEKKTLEQISLVEMIYPSDTFWRTYVGRKKIASKDASRNTLTGADKLTLDFHVSENVTLECGEVDGVVIGSWTNVDVEHVFPSAGEDDLPCGYWACAAVWCDGWDQKTFDRILLDQPSDKVLPIPWESQLDYYISHNNLKEIFKLLDVIPTSSFSGGSLKVCLGIPHYTAKDQINDEVPKYIGDICVDEESEPIYMDIPLIQFFRFFSVNMCSSWLQMHVEVELAKKHIFLKELWRDTAEILPLLTRAGLTFDTSKISLKQKLPGNPIGSDTASLGLDIVIRGDQSFKDNAEAYHRLFVHHCVKYNLPCLLDLYLDHHDLLLESDSLSSLQQAAGDSLWANWLLTSRIKGYEYEASFYNARSIFSRQMALGGNLSALETFDLIQTVDDMAEGGGEMVALATLMYSDLPMQKCLCSGSVNRQSNSSCQCTLENLRPGLQQFPTLLRVLVASCFGRDANEYPFNSGSTAIPRRSAFLDYLSWRHSIFSSTGGDASLELMVPCHLPKAIRRLVKIFVQGPVGWQPLSGVLGSEDSSIYRPDLFSTTNWPSGTNPISWEASIQQCIEKELYHSVEDLGFGVEHHLHRGRALAALNDLLTARALNMKAANPRQLQAGQSYQSDVQAILAPLTQNEKLTLTSVAPLALIHFKDPVLVSSCTFLLELCGLSASMLRVDVAALQRISSYYYVVHHSDCHDQVSPGSSFHAVPHEGDFTASLAQALADDYIHHNNTEISKKKDVPSKVVKDRQPSQALLTVLYHLEKASLPAVIEGKTAGSWLLTGSGDGSELRSMQKAASQNWNLVTIFCQMHHLPLSTVYLSLLAKDNDWVGFLTEAQLVGFPIDVVIQVAAEFSDLRLKTHILTVLRSLSLRKKPTFPTVAHSNDHAFMTDTNSAVPAELFATLAECEKQKNPGESLLRKAKELRWSLLAVIASCFSDASPLSCLTVWLEITLASETKQVDDNYAKIAEVVGAAVEATNALPIESRNVAFHYNRSNPKRCRVLGSLDGKSTVDFSSDITEHTGSSRAPLSQENEKKKIGIEQSKVLNDPDEGISSLSNMVALLCEQHQFLPLLRSFEMFLPSCSLLPFVHSLQAFSQMRLSDSAALLASFSARIKEEQTQMQINMTKDAQIKTSWISSTAVKAADAMLSRCPSAYEKRCLLQLLSAADFADGGSASSYFRRLYWKISLAEPSLRKDADVYLGNEILDDGSLLTALVKNGRWEEARSWARQLELSGASWKAAAHHVTEAQAEAMVAEWKEFLWDMPEERAALWSHCQKLFIRYSFPPLQAGLFFLRHAEAVEKDVPARELHEMLLLSLQWLSGTITQSAIVYPLHLLREIETRVWLLAVESETQSKAEFEFFLHSPEGGTNDSTIEQTANIITKMDNHLNAMRMKSFDRNVSRDNNIPYNRHLQAVESSNSANALNNTRIKRRPKISFPLRRQVIDNMDGFNDSDEYINSLQPQNHGEMSKYSVFQEEGLKAEVSISGWEERVKPAEMERAVLSLLEFGQITAAKQLQHKLSPQHVPGELVLIDSALKLAALSSSSASGELSLSTLDQELLSVIQSAEVVSNNNKIDPLQALEALASKCSEGCGRGQCRRIIAVVKAAKVLGIPFLEAYEKKPIDLLQLLSLKAQDSFEEAKVLVKTHIMAPPSIAKVLAESFLKGLLAAHRGGYIDNQKEEGPAPLLWRFADFLKWAELCPSEPEIGHALMRLVITGQEIPHACEVELLILSHHFYKSSACLDGVDVLVTLAANRVEHYVAEGDFSSLARLVTGVSNFNSLNFILNILVENGQLELLLQKYSSADTATGTAASVRGFRMAVLTSLNIFNPNDLDALAMVYNHFDMKHESASLLESRSLQYMQQWLSCRDKDRRTEDLLEAMRLFIEAAEVLSTVDAGQKTHRACAHASLLSLQIRIPDIQWIDLPLTRARWLLVEQSRFQEALIVAEAYNLNQPNEWAPVLWNLMLKPEIIEQFVAEFVSVLPLHPPMLLEVARFFRAEVAARGDQSHFSVWLSPGGLPAEWTKHLGKSFRSLLKRTRDFKLRLQLATNATGFPDVITTCMKIMDKVPENAGPLILRRGHGGAYLPLM